MVLLEHGEKNMIKYVISIDPGKATGVSYFKHLDGQDPVLINSSEVQPHEFAPWVRNTLADALGNCEADGGSSKILVVCERFVINAQTVRNSQAPYSIEQIGVLKQCLRDVHIDEESLLWQSPADAKAMFPNPALKKVGYWHKGGEGHALDSIRHGLLCLVKRGWVPSALLS
jgi:hypothetical protein